MKKWNEMTPEARDSAVAEKILGYDIGLYPSGTWVMWDSSGLDTPIPRFIQDMNAAKRVLDHIRATWTPEQATHFVDTLLGDAVQAYDLNGRLTPLTTSFLMCFDAERICKVALKVVEDGEAI